MKENSIKEDIKNAEHFIKSIKKDKEYKEENGWHGYYNKEIVELARILEHILSDYKRVLKENEHKTEKIENQKSELAILNDKQKDFNKLQNTLKSYKGQFRRQEKENEKLKNQEATARKINELLVQRYSNSISVQKVKDKIIHYQELQDNYIKKYDEINEGLQAMINVLQELIEEREEK